MLLLTTSKFCIYILNDNGNCMGNTTTILLFLRAFKLFEILDISPALKPKEYIFYSNILFGSKTKYTRKYVFIYLGFNVAFNTVQVISRRVVGRAEETST